MATSSAAAAAASPVLRVGPLGMPYDTPDPFLFCVYHLDRYPEGDAAMAPKGGRGGNGADFGNARGWNYYHGDKIPGFPAHPHR